MALSSTARALIAVVIVAVSAVSADATLSFDNSLHKGNEIDQLLFLPGGGAVPDFRSNDIVIGDARLQQPVDRRQRDRLPGGVLDAVSRDLVAGAVDSFAIRQHRGGRHRHRQSPAG